LTMLLSSKCSVPRGSFSCGATFEANLLSGCPAGKERTCFPKLANGEEEKVLLQQEAKEEAEEHEGLLEEAVAQDAPLAGNAALPFHIGEANGWRVSYRKVCPEQRGVKDFRGVLLRKMRAMQPVADKVAEGPRHRTAEELIAAKSATLARKRARDSGVWRLRGRVPKKSRLAASS